MSTEPHISRFPTKPRGRIARAFLFLAKLILPALVLSVGVGSYVYFKATRPEPPKRPQKAQIWPIQVHKVVFSDHQPQLRLYGETVSGRQVEMRALVGGKVVEVGANLREGGEVTAGETLLKIDPFTYDGAVIQAKANLDEAEARLVEARASLATDRDALKRAKEQLKIGKKDLSRALKLVKRKTLSQKSVDDRRLVVSQREQSVEQYQNSLKVQDARIRQLQAVIARSKWSLRQAERNLKDTVLRAPFDAYVSGTNAELGRLLNVNDKVASLLDKTWVDVRFVLSDGQYGSIIAENGSVIGRTVEVIWRVGNAPVTYTAKIERVAAQISAQSGGVQVYARIVDPLRPVIIRAGAFVEVMVPDRLYESVVQLPQTSLYGGNKVYVVKDGVLQEREVALVSMTGKDILVTGDLNQGEEVLQSRLSTAGEGVRVRVMEEGGKREKQRKPGMEDPGKHGPKKRLDASAARSGEMGDSQSSGRKTKQKRVPNGDEGATKNQRPAHTTGTLSGTAQARERIR